jgi:methyl-accepting chemotaxis protein
MKKLSIKFQLLGSLLIPILALLFFSATLLIDKTKVSKSMAKYSKATELSVKISNLVHETQKERGASAGFLGSKGAKFSDTMRKQRADTNEKLSELKDFIINFEFDQYDERFNSYFKAAMSDLDRLQDIRNRVDGLNITVQEEVGYYTQINSDMLNAVGIIGYMVTDTKISKDLNAYANFLLSKERAGIERAVLSNTFAADKFGSGMYKKFIQLVTEQNSYLSSFMITANVDFIDFYKSTVQGEPVNEVEKMRKAAFNNYLEGGFGVDASYWFSTITKKINLLKKTENYFADVILTEMKQKYSSAQKAKILYVTMFAVSLFFLVLLFYVIHIVVLGNIKKLADGINNLTRGNGDLTMRLETKERNEIGNLYDNLNEFIENIDHNLSNTLTQVSNAGDAVIPLINIVSDTSLSATSSNEVSSRVFSASEQMNTTISEIAESVVTSSGRMDETLRLAEDGKGIISDATNSAQEVSNVMSGLRSEINDLKEEADKIGSVISVINDIADQTNLLALNAAIEAARAGEAGRGFAVVADEVRKLAEKTQSSTTEISQMINNIQTDISTAVTSTESVAVSVDNQSELISGANRAFEYIVTSVADVNDLIGGISAAVEEQSSTTTEITESMQTVARDAGIMLAKAEELSISSERMVETLSTMDQEFARFKISNRAIPLIRGKISHAVYLSNVQKSVRDRNFHFDAKDDHTCGFGKMYFGEGQELFGSIPEYNDIAPLHKKVHEFGKEVIEKVKDEDIDTRRDAYEGFQHTVAEFMTRMNKLIDIVNNFK